MLVLVQYYASGLRRVTCIHGPLGTLVSVKVCRDSVTRLCLSSLAELRQFVMAQSYSAAVAAHVSRYAMRSLWVFAEFGPGSPACLAKPCRSLPSRNTHFYWSGEGTDTAMKLI